MKNIFSTFANRTLNRHHTDSQHYNLLNNYTQFITQQNKLCKIQQNDNEHKPTQHDNIQ